MSLEQSAACCVPQSGTFIFKESLPLNGTKILVCYILALLALLLFIYVL